jgi:hypothetical protein
VQRLLHFLIFADFVCAAVLLAMGIRLEFLKSGEMPERRFLSLRRPLPSELSKDYHTYHRRFLRLLLGLIAVILVGALLFWIDIVFFRTAN